MTQSWEKGTQELHVFAHNQDHMYKSEMVLTRINPKMIRIWLKWAKECLNVMSAWEPTWISQMGIKIIFYIFKPIILLLVNNLHSGLVKLGPRMTRSWEKGAHELHVFSHNRDHVYNCQMGVQIWFHILKWRIFLFKNLLHPRLNKINPKMIRIWLKWAKEWLNIARAQEPTYIS